MGRYDDRRRSRSRSRERDTRRDDHYRRDNNRDRRDRDRPYRDRSRSRSREPPRWRGDAHPRDHNTNTNNNGREAEHNKARHHRPNSPSHPPPTTLPGTATAVATATTNNNSTSTSAGIAKKEPLSLEQLLQQRQVEKDQANRPVFLTKQQRAELALKKRAEGAALYRAHTDTLRQELAKTAAGGRAQPVVVVPSSHPRPSSQSYKAEKEREKELEMIKQQYLGAEKPKKKTLKLSDKQRFVFDWDASEDTSRDLNPLYDHTHEAALLFGRGFRAGIDRREQKKLSAEAEQQALRQLRAAAGREETYADRARALARADKANRYDDRGDMRVDTHWSEKTRAQMTERDWRIFREDFNISYKGAIPQAALPIRNWDEANLPDPVRRAVERVGYKKPSPIQMASIPLGLHQRDVIGVAETGSGKTAAFVLPMLAYILKQPKMKGNPEVEAEGPYAVVLAPTRELAQQIEEEARSLAHYTEFRVVSIVGGQSIEEQGFALRQGCEIVVATPGRLVDCIERRYAVLNQCNYVVLDEADRMIDMGFEPQVTRVLDAMPSSNLKPENEEEALEENKIYRTTYMFSATMPPAVERLARTYLRRPVVVNIGAAGKATANVSQRVSVMKENEKPSALERSLASVPNKSRVIVFVNTQKKCETVARAVEGSGYAATMLHGGKSQDQREDSIRGFRETKYTVLVATDVAGRGIDVPDVSLVVNYDMPLTIEAYTHRIGRTGRAGKKGDAITFLTMGDTDVFYDLKKFLMESSAPVPKELANSEAARKKPGEKGGGGGGGQQIIR